MGGGEGEECSFHLFIFCEWSEEVIFLAEEEKRVNDGRIICISFQSVSMLSKSDLL